jgi:hypothetical protein
MGGQAMAVKLQDGGWFREFPLIGGLAGHALRNFTALVALLGGFLYALIALAYERFYRALGIAPKDVGITPGTIVPRTAVALALFIALGAGTYFAVYALLSLILRWLTPSMTALATLAVLAVLGPIVISRAIGPALLSGPFARITWSLAVVLFIASVVTMLLLRRPSQRSRIVVLAGWMVVLAIFFFGGVRFTAVRADNLARAVLTGETEIDVITFVFDVHADPVCINAGGVGGSPSQPEYRLYLGEANGWLALYDPASRVTERLSNEGKSMSFLTESSIRPC